MPEKRNDLKAAYLLRENIRMLLEARVEDQALLARWCGHSRSWLNKFLTGGRDLALRDLDRIAAFFALAPYQLFQPGLSGLTERRQGDRRQQDRRTGQDRRLGYPMREAVSLRAEIETARQRMAAHAAIAPVPVAVRQAVDKAVDELDSLDAARIRAGAVLPDAQATRLARQRAKRRDPHGRLSGRPPTKSA